MTAPKRPPIPPPPLHGEWEPCPRCSGSEAPRQLLACTLCGRMHDLASLAVVPTPLAAAYRLGGLIGAASFATGDGVHPSDAYYRDVRRRLYHWRGVGRGAVQGLLAQWAVGRGVRPDGARSAATGARTV